MIGHIPVIGKEATGQIVGEGDVLIFGIIGLDVLQEELFVIVGDLRVAKSGCVHDGWGRFSWRWRVHGHALLSPLLDLEIYEILRMDKSTARNSLVQGSVGHWY